MLTRGLLLLSTLIVLPLAAAAQPAVAPAVPPARTAPAAAPSRTPAPVATPAPAPVAAAAPSADDPPTSDAAPRATAPAPVAATAPRPSASAPRPNAAVPAVGPARAGAAASAPPVASAAPTSAPPSADAPPTTDAVGAVASAAPASDAPPTTTAPTATAEDGVIAPESLQTVPRNFPLTPEGNAAFLAGYGARADVKKLPSGVMYRVLVEGKGKNSPLGRTDTVTVTYRGWMIDGTQFDATQPGSPRSFQVGGLIAGWREALLKMKQGDLWEIVIPAELAYGADGRAGRIPPNQTLVFVVSLAKIEYAG